MAPYQVPGSTQAPPMTYEQALAHVSPQPAWGRYHHAPASVDRLLNVRPGGVERLRQFDPNFSVDLLAFTPGATAGTNAAKIESTLAGLQQQPQQQGSGGPGLNPLDAGMLAADLTANTLPLTQGPVGAPDAAQAAVQRTAASRGIVADPWGEPTVPSRLAAPPAPGPAVRMIDELPTGMGPTPLHRSVAASVPEAVAALDAPVVADVSGGGPGTSTAKGNATIARQAAKRAGGGKGFLGTVDDFISTPGQSVGAVAQGGVRNAAAMASKAGMPGTAAMLKGLAPAARWAAPVGLFAATTGLPAVMGAMEGNEKAGVGGAVLQGGGALAGAAIGQALIPIPVVGAGIGAMVGNAVGSGLTGLAQGAVEKAQMGDSSFVGGIGRALDPFIDTDYEKEQKAVMQQMNSPAMQAVRQQERARQERARAEQMEALLMQSYLR